MHLERLGWSRVLSGSRSNRHQTQQLSDDEHDAVVRGLCRVEGQEQAIASETEVPPACPQQPLSLVSLIGHLQQIHSVAVDDLHRGDLKEVEVEAEAVVTGRRWG